MGETLGISQNVFEKAERQRDRKERMKALEDWNKEKQIRIKRASVYSSRSPYKQNPQQQQHPQLGPRSKSHLGVHAPDSAPGDDERESACAQAETAARAEEAGATPQAVGAAAAKRGSSRSKSESDSGRAERGEGKRKGEAGGGSEDSASSKSERSCLCCIL